jgi:hypothetical protein
MNFLKPLTDLFAKAEQEIPYVADSTVYRIKTNASEYSGKIIYQNDVVIKFDTGSKPIKILKANIANISIISAGKNANHASESKAPKINWKQQYV